VTLQGGQDQREQQRVDSELGGGRNEGSEVGTYRPARAVRHPEVALGQAGQVAEVLRHHRPVQAQPVAFRQDLAAGGLRAEHRVHRIDRGHLLQGEHHGGHE